MSTLDVSDLRPTIVSKSDQLNSEQLLGGPMTIKVTEVAVNVGEQPVSVHYEGENGRPYKPCLTMRKLLVFAWGEDGRNWCGRSMTLYNDPAVKFGGVEVGGIRISHLSHIPGDIRVSLTTTRGKKAPITVKPLRVEAPQSTTTLEQVLAVIEAAQTPEDMRAAQGLAKQLTADDDRQQARNAYAAKRAAMTKEAA